MAHILSISKPEEEDAAGLTDMVVTGQISSVPDGGTVYYVAAAPPDYRSSFAGSAMPFASREQAFYNTPNRGVVRVSAVDRLFTVQLRTPNSYYDDNYEKVPPTLHLVYYSSGQKASVQLQVSEGVPFRDLTYPAKRTSPMFYAPEAPLIRSQEQILRASAYPDLNHEPDNFWGQRPPR